MVDPSVSASAKHSPVARLLRRRRGRRRTAPPGRRGSTAGVAVVRAARRRRSRAARGSRAARHAGSDQAAWTGSEHGHDPATSVPGMDFSPSPRAADLTARVGRVPGRGDRAGRGGVPPRPRRAAAHRRPVAAAAGDRGAQGQGPRARPVEPLPAQGARRRVRRAVRHRRRRGPDQRRLRADRRAHRPVRDRAAGAQLQRARHRQHGGAAQVRHRRAARASGSSRCSTAGSARRSR